MKKEDAITITIVVAFVFFIINKAMGGIFGTGAGAGAAAKAAKMNKGKGGKTSFSRTTYMNFADGIEKILGGGFTEDEDAILRIFNQMKTDADIDELTIAFGERRQPFTVGGVSLATWLNRYMGKKDIQKLNTFLAKNNFKTRY